MSSFDRITGSYNLETIGNTVCGTGDINFTANNGSGGFYINGNLYVSGSTTTVQTINSVIDSQYVTVNGNISGTPTLDAGLKVERGNEIDVFIKWSETVNAWQITNNGVDFANIATEPILRNLRQDTSPRLGNHLYTDCFEIRSPYPCNIKLNPGYDETNTRGALQIYHTLSVVTVPYEPGSSLLYAQGTGAGQTGLYTTTPEGFKEELITKRKSLIYSLLL